MSYISLQLDDDDIQFDGNGQLIMTPNIIEGIAQSYKVLIETTYGSDFRDPEYGFKLDEFFNSTYDDKLLLLERFTEEALRTHVLTANVSDIVIEKIEERKYRVSANVEVKTGEIINVIANIG